MIEITIKQLDTTSVDKEYDVIHLLATNSEINNVENTINNDRIKKKIS